MRDVLSRFYNCPVVNLRDRSPKVSSLVENESHCNILPANLVFETNKYFYLLQVRFLILILDVLSVLIIDDVFFLGNE